MTDTEKNAAWLPTVKSLMRKIAADYNVSSQTPNMGYKLRYGPTITTSLALPVQPSQNVVTWFYQLVAFHQSTNPTHGVTLIGATNFTPTPGRTIYYHPLGNIAFAAPEPSPYDEPPIVQPPPSCIPCIEPIYIARGPA